MTKKLDPSLFAYRPDLADISLKEVVSADAYTPGKLHRVKRGTSALYAQPDDSSSINTFLRYGDVVRVFEERGHFAWVQNIRDRYVGYLAHRDLAATTEDASPVGHFTPLMTHVYATPDMKGRPIDVIPRGSSVFSMASPIKTRTTEYVRIDEEGYVPAQCLSDTPPRSTDLFTAAALYLNAPYLWAGTTFSGIDCSSLVQNACSEIGLMVPRDTYMQRDYFARIGAVSEIPAIPANHLVYMPGHVVITGTDGNVIHADGELMKVHVEPLHQFVARRGKAPEDMFLHSTVTAG